MAVSFAAAFVTGADVAGAGALLQLYNTVMITIAAKERLIIKEVYVWKERMFIAF